MYNENFLDSIISKIDVKINRAVNEDSETALFTVCFFAAMTAIITGVAVDLFKILNV